jgi:hypothetical protein
MESKKVMILVLGIGCALTLSAQPITEVRKGHLRSQANLSWGYMPVQKQSAAYISGDWDAFITNYLSLYGEGWFNIPTHSGKGLRSNHSLISGMNYHFVKSGKWDPFVGGGPGMNIYTIRYGIIEGGWTNSTRAAPVVSAVLGCNFYAGSIFNFFVKMRGMAGMGNHRAVGTVPLHEIRISAGMGWNTLKPLKLR